MNRLLPILLFCLPGAVVAQELLIRPELRADELHFDPTFMERNGIASIQGILSVKREMEPIRKKQERYHYRFDEQGRTIYRNTSFGNPGTGMDTASITFSYRPDDTAEREVRNDLNGYYVMEHAYDDEGRLIRQTYVRVENLGKDRYEFIPGDRTEISDEHYTYRPSGPTSNTRIYLNDQKLPFREETRTYNSDGYLINIEDLYLVSRRRSMTLFTYDEQGRLHERIERPNGTTENEVRHVYRYDVAGNLIERDVWKNNAKYAIEQYLYDERTMLLNARLVKDLETNLIHILQFEHEFR